MVHGKTIQMYLPDGNPRGIKIAEITSRTVQAVLVPRSMLSEAAERDEVHNVGVYFLIGIDDVEAKPILYVGEAEDCLVRLKQHNRSKDFWTVALVLVSKTKYFTKSHVKYLEWHCHDAANKAARYRLENNAEPNKPYVPEPVEADLLDNYETIKSLVSTLGYPLFDQMVKPRHADMLYCKNRDVIAKGQYTSEGLVVLKDSTCNLEESKVAPQWIVSARQRLLDDETLIKDGDLLRFTTDLLYATPSQAAAIVLGRSANGWLEWKFKDGRTLDKVVRQEGSK